MQSGIIASTELHNAFKTFLQSQSLALLVTISSESLVPKETIDNASSAPFPTSMSAVHAAIQSNEALYILLRTPVGAGLVAITYVPDTAPVRSKMLFASTRLTLTRELGTEHFSETTFVTNRDDLSEAGWRAHESSRAAENPLTGAEVESKMLREADRGAAVSSSTTTPYALAGMGGQGLALKMDDGLHDALRLFKDAGQGALLTVRLDVATESLQLDARADGVQPGDLAAHISTSDPRYAFFKPQDTVVVFMYTCPGTSKIKERMLYASGKSRMTSLAESEGGFSIDRKLEASSPQEFTIDEIVEDENHKEKEEEKKAFSRPRRPGKR